MTIETEAVVVPETGETIEAQWCPISIRGEVSCQLLVSLGDRDEMSASLRAGTYAFPKHYSLLLQLAQPGSQVIDLGAHLGTFTLYAAIHGYRVLAVEASRRNVALLKAALARNGFHDVPVVSAAVSDRNGSVEFIQAGPYGHVASDVAQTRSATIRVRAVTVDDVLAEHQRADVGFVKMDIEGSEAAALDGMCHLLGREQAPPIVYESNGHTLRLCGHTPADLLSRLAAYGYRCYLLHPGQLIATAADDLQFECNVDCLAAKQLPSRLNEWSLVTGMTPSTQRQLALQSCAARHPHLRAHVGRTLQRANRTFLSDPQIARALNALKNDPDADVRGAVDWWARDRLVPLRALKHHVGAAWHRGKRFFDA